MAPMRHVLSELASSFDTMGAAVVALTSWFLEIIPGNNPDFDGARGLERVKKSKPWLIVHITFNIHTADMS